MTLAELLTTVQILVILGGGFAAVVLMRSQIADLTRAIRELTLAVNSHETRIAKLEWEAAREMRER